jgi:hypothetical protein
MDIYEWNAVFVMMGGSVVCSGCMMAQQLEDERQVFPHAIGCKHDDPDTQHPWWTLQQLIDQVRG